VVRSVAWLEIIGVFAPHPSPLPREREPISVDLELEFASVFQVTGPFASTPVSPLSLWERARVRDDFTDR